jgi:hypothetical protein
MPGHGHVPSPRSRVGCDDARGAVFVEKLVVIIPVLLVFFLGWELAEVGAASLIVQRASAAAGRAAMVVLPDDPGYYGDEPTHSYAGARRADIELAAGMTLSAIPQLSDDFEVDVSPPPRGFGTIDVTVRGSYTCPAVGLICGLRDTLTLSSTTQHAYHGASYEYSVPSDVGSSAQGLSLGAAGGRSVGVSAQALSAKSPDTASAGGCFECTPDGRFADNPVLAAALREPPNGRKVTGSNALAERVKQIRCKPGNNTGRNYAALSWECRDPNQQNKVVATGIEDGVSTSGDDGGLHGEFEAIKAYSERLKADNLGKYECKIIELYTEREPCSDRCRSPLFDVLKKQGEFTLKRVTYSFDYNVSSAVDPAVIQSLLGDAGECTLANEEAKRRPDKSPQIILKQRLDAELEKLGEALKTKATADAKAQCSSPS